MPSPGLTRYQPLIDHLAGARAAEVVLTLAEIEALIGAPLSVSACCHPSVWREGKNAQVRAWGRLGWRARLDTRNHCVIFTRQEG